MGLFSFAKKRILFVLILLVVLLIGAAGLVVLNLGKVVNSNKDVILAKAKEVVGREITVGQIDVTIWTGIGVRLSNFAIADDPAFSGEEFVSADNLEIYFKLMPLFRKQLEISHLTLIKPSIRAVQNKKGEYNFSTLLEKSSSGETADSPSTAGSGGQSPALSLARLEIEDGVIQYKNETNNQEFSITNLDATVRDFALDQSFSVDTQAAVLNDAQNVRFTGKIGPLSAAGQKLGVSGDLNVDTLPIAKLPFLSASLPEYIKADGDIRGKIALEGSLDNLVVTADLDGNDAVLNYNKQYEKPKGMPLQIAAKVNYTGKSATVQEFKVNLDSVQAGGTGNIGLGKTLTYDFTLQSDPIDAVWITTILPDYKDYKPTGKVTLNADILKNTKSQQVTGSLSLDNVSASIPGLAKPVSQMNGKVNFDLNKAKTEGINFLLGQSKFNLDSSVNSYTDLSGSYGITADSIQVADLIDAPDSMKNDELKTVKVSGQFDMKKGLQTSGRLSSQEGNFYGIPFNQLKSPYRLADNVLTIKPLSLQTLNGAIEGNVVYDMQKDPPAFDVKTQTKNLDLAELARSQFKWFPEFIQGKVNMKMDLAGSGTTWDAIKPTLQGSGALDIAKGMLMNVNLAESVLNGMTGMPGITNFVTTNYKEEYPAVFASKHTVFEALKLETAIQGGRINFKNMLISSADWAVNGNGFMDFNQQLKSDALLRLSKDFSSFLTGKVSAFKYLTDTNGNMAIPFSLTGMLPTLKPAPNSDFLGGILQKAVLGQAAEKLDMKGLPGFSNLLNLPFNTAPKSSQSSQDQAIPSKDKIQRDTSAPRDVSSPQGTKKETQAAVPTAATPTVTQPTKVSPADLLNPFLKLLDKKNKRD